MTQNAIFAFTCEDIRLAKEAHELNDQVDGLPHRISKPLQTACCGKTWSG